MPTVSMENLRRAQTVEIVERPWRDVGTLSRGGRIWKNYLEERKRRQREISQHKGVAREKREKCVAATFRGPRKGRVRSVPPMRWNS